MVPLGATRLELSFEAAPGPHGDGMQLELLLEGTAFYKGELKNSEPTIVSVDLDEDIPEIILIQAKSARFFIPRERGLSEDARKLSAKLVGIRWFF